MSEPEHQSAKEDKVIQAQAEILRPLIDLRDRAIQKNRIAFSHRVTAIEQGRDEADAVTQDLLIRWRDRFVALEAELDADIKEIAATIPIIEEMENVKGVGFMLAAKVVSMIDIKRCNTVSALWRFSGLGVIAVCEDCNTLAIQGQKVCSEDDCGGNVVNKAERLRKGEKAHFNKRLKTYCWQLGTSFLKSNSPYRAIYDKGREQYEDREGWSDMRKHRAAMRKMIKTFLQHMWVRWRELEGLPVNEPYILGKNGHSHYVAGSEYGWPTGEKRTAKKKKKAKPDK